MEVLEPIPADIRYEKYSNRQPCMLTFTPAGKSGFAVNRNLLVFGLWVKTRGPRGNPIQGKLVKEFMQGNGPRFLTRTLFPMVLTTALSCHLSDIV